MGSLVRWVFPVEVLCVVIQYVWMDFDFHGGWMVRLGAGDGEMQEDERGMCCWPLVLFCWLDLSGWPATTSNDRLMH